MLRDFLKFISGEDDTSHMGASADTAVLRPLTSAVQGTSAATVGEASGVGTRVVKFLAAVALLPVCIGFTQGFGDVFLSLKNRVWIEVVGLPQDVRWFLGGVAIFAIFTALVYRAVTLYVFSHELCHALATWMCLGSVSNLRASANGGQVTTSKSNTFIRLAPYFVPFYAVALAAAFLLLNAYWRPLGAYRGALAFGLGVTLAFHFGFTLWSLRRGQSDLKSDGWFFSMVVIYVVNVLVLAAAGGLLLSGNAYGAWDTLRSVCVTGWGRSADLYQSTYLAVLDVVRNIRT